VSLRKKRFLGIFLLVVFLVTFLLLEFNFAQQAAQKVEEEKAQVKDDQQKIIPSAKNIKESTGIYVFLAWMWIAIAVLIYILRLKIREVDRLHRLRFLSAKKK
jgi:preprotein translocase subunit Sec63